MPIPSLHPALTVAGLSVTLGAVGFNQNPDPNGVAYVLTTLEGWDSPPLREDLQERARDHGGYQGSSYYQPRRLTLTGTLVGPGSMSALKTARDDLLEATDLTDTAALLTVADLPDKQCQVRRSGEVRIEVVAAHLLRFQIPLVAVDPRKYGTVLRSATLTVGSTADAVNTGRFREGAPLTAVFTGPLGTPVLSIGGQTLGLSSVSAGEVVTVDTLEDTVLLASGVSAYPRLVGGSTFVTVPKRATSTVSLSGSGSGSVTLTWRDTWI